MRCPRWASGCRGFKRCAVIDNLEGIAQTVRTVKPDVVVERGCPYGGGQAESEREAFRSAERPGRGGLAEESAKLGALMVHYSTDYVFDGQGSHIVWKMTRPAAECVRRNQTSRGNRAGAGESAPSYFPYQLGICHRGANFAKTMLRLAGEKEALSIINDQHGAPTSAELLADWQSPFVKNSAIVR